VPVSGQELPFEIEVLDLNDRPDSNPIQVTVLDSQYYVSDDFGCVFYGRTSNQLESVFCTDTQVKIHKSGAYTFFAARSVNDDSTFIWYADSMAPKQLKLLYEFPKRMNKIQAVSRGRLLFSGGKNLLLLDFEGGITELTSEIDPWTIVDMEGQGEDIYL
jgi:hypothetical protein